MQAFTYHRPETLAEAAALLDRGEARLLAGGQTLVPAMRARRERPAHLIDLAGIEALRGIVSQGDTLTLGAMTCHAEIAGSEAVREAIPALAAMVEVVGDPALRHRGTFGGTLAVNDPAADYPAACLALGATIVTHRREIAAEAFFTGLRRTALAPDEIITAIRLPACRRAAYAKFRHPTSRYALVGVFVAAPSEGGVRVAVTGSGAAGVFRWTEAEAALEREVSPAALEGLTVSPRALVGDVHADPGYRAHLVGVMARRAVAAALAR